jgi:hypothetical protein
MSAHVLPRVPPTVPGGRCNVARRLLARRFAADEGVFLPHQIADEPEEVCRRHFLGFLEVLFHHAIVIKAGVDFDFSR